MHSLRHYRLAHHLLLSLCPPPPPAAELLEVLRLLVENGALSAVPNDDLVYSIRWLRLLIAQDGERAAGDTTVAGGKGGGRRRARQLPAMQAALALYSACRTWQAVVLHELR